MTVNGTHHNIHGEIYLLNSSFCYAFEYTQSFIFYGILCPTVAIMTLVVNCLVIGVFVRRKMRTPTTTLLIALAVADAGAGAVMIPFYIYFYALENYRAYMTYPVCIYYDFAYYFANIFHTSSAWVTTILGIQRYIVVAFPLKGRRICTNKASIIAIIGAYLTAFAMYFPQFFYKEYYNVWVNVGNDTLTTLCRCPITNLPHEYEDILVAMKGCVAKLIPCFVLIITTILLVRHLEVETERILQLHADDFEGERKDFRQIRRTSIMVILIVVSFLLVEIPAGVKLVITVLDKQLIKGEENLMSAMIINFFLLLSYHINFWIYLCLSEQFRNSLRRLLCKDKTRKGPITETSHVINSTHARLSVFHVR